VALALQKQLLKDHGHDIEVITFDNNQIDGFSKITAGLKAFYNISSAKRTSQVITQFKPAIIHIHNLFFTASPSVLFVAKKHNIPVIFTLHNYRLICANALLLRNNKICELCVNKSPLGQA
jgi:UDP-N-acetylglucosamine:LPS N-acetylglucosamine transferase